MPRFHYIYCELEDGTWEYVIFDRRRGSDNHLALCVHEDDAQKIVHALNAHKRPSLGVFG